MGSLEIQMQSEISGLLFKPVIRAGDDKAIGFIVLPWNIADKGFNALLDLRTHGSAYSVLDELTLSLWGLPLFPETVFVLLRSVSNPSRAPLGIPSCSRTAPISIPIAFACAITPK